MSLSEIPPLATPDQLAGLPGEPFTPIQVARASDAVRQVAGWHIAPRITQTLILDHTGANRVMLPSLNVHDVVSVSWLRPGREPTPLRGWSWSQHGFLAGRFPMGYRVLEVVLDHGYETAPPALLGVLAQVSTEGKIRSRQAGPFTETYETSEHQEEPTSVSAIIARYSLPPRP